MDRWCLRGLLIDVVGGALGRWWSSVGPQNQPPSVFGLGVWYVAGDGIIHTYIPCPARWPRPEGTPAYHVIVHITCRSISYGSSYISLRAFLPRLSSLFTVYCVFTYIHVLYLYFFLVLRIIRIRSTTATCLSLFSSWLFLRTNDRSLFSSSVQQYLLFFFCKGW